MQERHTIDVRNDFKRGKVENNVIIAYYRSMMYQSQKLSPEEIKRKKHRMQTMQMSRDSDLKRAKNKQNAAAADVHRLKTEIMRFQSELKEREQEFKKLRTEEEFLTDELRHIKKVLMNLK